MKNLLLFVFCVLISGTAFGQTTLAFQSFEGNASDTWTYTQNPVSGTFTSSADLWDVVSSLSSITPTDGNNFFGGRDVENSDNPNGNFATLDFGVVTVTGNTAVTVSFDYNVIGFDGPDNLFYTLTVDGTPQAEVTLATGTNSGTETINIPNGSTSVSLQVKVIQNGSSDYCGLDNFKVIGISSSIPSILLSSISGNTSETGTTATFDVSLNTQPTNDVVIDVTSGNTAENTVSPTQLTFTNANYNTPQTVTITGVDDAVVDGDQTTTITLTVDDAASDDDYDGLSANIDVVNEDDEVFPLVINEILADPGSVNDANGDGVFSSTDDEFVELVNTGATTLNLSNYTVSDASNVKFTFPVGTLLEAGKSFVVFGGGTPTGIPGMTAVASSGLSFNNSSDNVIVKNPAGQTVVSYAYGSEANDDQSIARSPDYTGAFVKHSTIATNPVSNSVGRLNADGTPLPVELLTFTATPSKTAIHLDWSTATEENNAYFEVQSSIDGKNFETIGQVEGAGTTYEVQEYTFIDENPANGVNYYRLRQVDFDGRFEYHKVVAAVLNGDVIDVLVIPTQVNNQFDVVFGEVTNEAVQMDIFSVNGQLLKSEMINANTNRQTIDVSNLDGGLYIIRMNVNNSMMTKRFVKL